MPINVPGLLVPLQLLFRPHILVPSLIIKDLRCLDFKALKRLGYKGLVLDKDNCLTLPHDDHLVPELKEAWSECRSVFGPENVIIVSNSAGTRVDPSGIQAESVSYQLGVPVLRHQGQKPSYSCIRDIRKYFASLKTPVTDNELVVIGDRVFTDVVLANRMRVSKKGALEEHTSEDTVASSVAAAKRDTPLAVLTEKIWKREALLMRLLEKRAAKFMSRWVRPGQVLSDEQEALVIRKKI